MRITIDVMGGDHGSGVIVEGVWMALQEQRAITRATLVGDEAEIRRTLSARQFQDDRIEILHTRETLTMDDKPVDGVRKKKNCSIAKGIDLLKGNESDVFVSSGNTGGVVTVATIKLGRLPGVDRAGIATVIPTSGNRFVLLDSGANIDCKPIHLAHFAVMGSIFSRKILGYRRPRVGILSVGTEDSKGNELTLEAFRLCRELDLNFIGNVEGHDLFSNRVDVVVCDGFVGNVVLKACESLATCMIGWVKQELSASPVGRLGALLARGVFRKIRDRMDPDVYGGAPLLGLNGNVFIAHGSAKERAIRNAIQLTTNAFQSQINQRIIREIARANELLAARGLLRKSVAA